MEQDQLNNLKVVTELNGFSEWVYQHIPLLVNALAEFIVAIIIIIIGHLLSKFISKWVLRVLNARTIDPTVSNFLAVMLRYIILIFAIVAALGRIGVQTTSIIAVIGAAGLAVGLALQGSLSNFAAGVILIVFRPFKVGEYVDLGGKDAGTIRCVQIFSTSVYTSDGQLIIVPNSKIISNNIINYSREPNRRMDLIIGVDYSADIDFVKQVLNEVVDKEEKVLRELGITIRLKEMANSSLNFLVRVWTTNSNYWPTQFDLLENIKKALDANHINIPYPTMDVNVRQIKDDKQ